MKPIYQSPEVDYKRRRPSKTVPDQSLSIQEIVKRYVRGIPVDVVRRKGVYLDQTEDDLEKVARGDFSEKAEYAQLKAEHAAALNSDLDEAQKEYNDRKAKERSEHQKAAQAEYEAKQVGKNPPA